MFKAHDYPKVYEDLGIDLSLLGCIMLNIPAQSVVDKVKEIIPELDAYYARDNKRFWIKGLTSVEDMHCTLLYGLTRTGAEYRKHVDTVLDGRLPGSVTVDHVSYFDSPYENEEYYCIVAHLVITPELQEAHDRLTMLPHIKTFPGYKAHITLGYIVKDEEKRDEYVSQLNQALKMSTVPTGGINYGGN